MARCKFKFSIIAFSLLLASSLLSLGNTISNKEEEELKKYKEKARVSSNADTILFYAQKAYSIAEKRNLPVSGILILIGDGYLQSGNHSKALETFLKAATLYDSENNRIGLATSYSYISNIYNSQNSFKNAISYLKKSIDIFKELNDSIRLVSALHNLGYTYYSISKNDSALMLFDQAKEIYQRIGAQFEYAYCIGNTGLVYLKQKKYSEAEKHLSEAIELLSEYEDYAIIEFMNAYAKVLYEMGEAKKATSYAKHSYSLALENNIKEYERDAAFCLSKLYSSVNQFDSAFFYLTSYYTVRDSIKNLETIQQMADLRTDFEVNQKQQEVNTLLKSKTIQLIIISALLIIVILATWLIVVYRKNLRRVREFTTVLDKRRKELEAQKTELKELNTVKDKFFSIISHDLRSPINSLGGISFMIREGIQNNNPQILWEVVDYIDKTTFSLSSLLDNLLNWAMFQQGKLKVDLVRIEMKPLVNEVVEVFSTFVVSKDIQLKLMVEDDIFIKGERNSVMTILRNLMSNAIKFTEKGKRISISCNKVEDDWVKLVLEDQGVGMPKEKLDDIFRIGKNKSTFGTEKEKGLGLGLSLVHEFVVLNKGKINVESEVGVGTKFTLLFKESV